ALGGIAGAIGGVLGGVVKSGARAGKGLFGLGKGIVGGIGAFGARTLKGVKDGAQVGAGFRALGRPGQAVGGFLGGLVGLVNGGVRGLGAGAQVGFRSMTSNEGMGGTLSDIKHTFLGNRDSSRSGANTTKGSLRFGRDSVIASEIEGNDEGEGGHFKFDANAHEFSDQIRESFKEMSSDTVENDRIQREFMQYMGRQEDAQEIAADFRSVINSIDNSDGSLEDLAQGAESAPSAHEISTAQHTLTTENANLTDLKGKRDAALAQQASIADLSAQRDLILAELAEEGVVVGDDKDIGALEADLATTKQEEENLHVLRFQENSQLLAMGEMGDVSTELEIAEKKFEELKELGGTIEGIEKQARNEIVSEDVALAQKILGVGAEKGAEKEEKNHTILQNLEKEFNRKAEKRELVYRGDDVDVQIKNFQKNLAAFSNIDTSTESGQFDKDSKKLINKTTKLLKKAHKLGGIEKMEGKDLFTLRNLINFNYGDAQKTDIQKAFGRHSLTTAEARQVKVNFLKDVKGNAGKSEASKDRIEKRTKELVNKQGIDTDYMNTGVLSMATSIAENNIVNINKKMENHKGLQEVHQKNIKDLNTSIATAQDNIATAQANIAKKTEILAKRTSLSAIDEKILAQGLVSVEKLEEIEAKIQSSETTIAAAKNTMNRSKEGAPTNEIITPGIVNSQKNSDLLELLIGSADPNSKAGKNPHSSGSGLENLAQLESTSFQFQAVFMEAQRGNLQGSDIQSMLGHNPDGSKKANPFRNEGEFQERFNKVIANHGRGGFAGVESGTPTLSDRAEKLTKQIKGMEDQKGNSSHSTRLIEQLKIRQARFSKLGGKEDTIFKDGIGNLRKNIASYGALSENESYMQGVKRNLRENFGMDVGKKDSTSFMLPSQRANGQARERRTLATTGSAVLARLQDNTNEFSKGEAEDILGKYQLAHNAVKNEAGNPSVDPGKVIDKKEELIDQDEKVMARVRQLMIVGKTDQAAELLMNIMKSGNNKGFQSIAKDMGVKAVVQVMYSLGKSDPEEAQKLQEAMETKVQTQFNNSEDRATFKKFMTRLSKSNGMIDRLIDDKAGAQGTGSGYQRYLGRNLFSGYEAHQKNVQRRKAMEILRERNGDDGLFGGMIGGAARLVGGVLKGAKDAGQYSASKTYNSLTDSNSSKLRKGAVGSLAFIAGAVGAAGGAIASPLTSIFKGAKKAGNEQLQAGNYKGSKGGEAFIEGAKIGAAGTFGLVKSALKFTGLLDAAEGLRNDTRAAMSGDARSYNRRMAGDGGSGDILNSKSFWDKGGAAGIRSSSATAFQHTLLDDPKRANNIMSYFNADEEGFTDIMDNFMSRNGGKNKLDSLVSFLNDEAAVGQSDTSTNKQKTNGIQAKLNLAKIREYLDSHSGDAATRSANKHALTEEDLQQNESIRDLMANPSITQSGAFTAAAVMVSESADNIQKMALYGIDVDPLEKKAGKTKLKDIIQTIKETDDKAERFSFFKGSNASLALRVNEAAASGDIESINEVVDLINQSGTPEQAAAVLNKLGAQLSDEAKEFLGSHDSLGGLADDTGSSGSGFKQLYNASVAQAGSRSNPIDTITKAAKARQDFERNLKSFSSTVLASNGFDSIAEELEAIEDEAEKLERVEEIQKALGSLVAQAITVNTAGTRNEAVAIIKALGISFANSSVGTKNIKDLLFESIAQNTKALITNFNSKETKENVKTLLVELKESDKDLGQDLTDSLKRAFVQTAFGSIVGAIQLMPNERSLEIVQKARAMDTISSKQASELVIASIIEDPQAARSFVTNLDV
ncbi:hypothetical protein DID80_07200, partial [Candidatus Marinamargulisbacteria bacterium SCGC AAA071-K20]